MMFPPGQHYTSDKMAQFRDEALARRLRSHGQVVPTAWTGHPPTPRFSMPWTRAKETTGGEPTPPAASHEPLRTGPQLGPTSNR